jgi:hypothetical protein
LFYLSFDLLVVVENTIFVKRTLFLILLARKKVPQLFVFVLNCIIFLPFLSALGQRLPYHRWRFLSRQGNASFL